MKTLVVIIYFCLSPCEGATDPSSASAYFSPIEVLRECQYSKQHPGSIAIGLLKKIIERGQYQIDLPRVVISRVVCAEQHIPTNVG